MKPFTRKTRSPSSTELRKTVVRVPYESLLRHLVALIISLNLTMCMPSQAIAGQARLHQDKNGYFTAVLPADWEEENYPSESIRSKVKFFHPADRECYIMVYAYPLSVSTKTIDDIYKENKEKVDISLPHRFPTGTFAIERKKVASRDAVLLRMSVPGSGPQDCVLFVSCGLFYNITCAARNQSQLNSNYDVFNRFMEVFVFLDPGKKFSDEERQAAQVARYKRLMELNLEAGKRQEALNWVKEALSFYPQNVDLQKLQNQLELKESRHEAIQRPTALSSAPTSGVSPVIPASSPVEASFPKQPTSANPSVETPPAESGKPNVYAVRRGDTLSKIAARFYGNGNAWYQIYRANRSVITDKDKLLVGTVLTIPPNK